MAAELLWDWGARMWWEDPGFGVRVKPGMLLGLPWGCCHAGKADPTGAGGHSEWQGTTCLLPNPLASQLSPACVPQANCRAWGLFHAVLMRQTLCFYQDRRDSLKVCWGREHGRGLAAE